MLKRSLIAGLAAACITGAGANRAEAAAIAYAHQYYNVSRAEFLSPECSADCFLYGDVEIAIHSLSVTEFRHQSGTGQITNNPLMISNNGLSWSAEVNSGAQGVVIESKRADFIIKVTNKTGFDFSFVLLEHRWSPAASGNAGVSVDDVRYEYASYFSAVPFLPVPDFDPNTAVMNSSLDSSSCDTLGNNIKSDNQFQQSGLAASCRWATVWFDEYNTTGIGEFPKNAVAYVAGSLILEVRAISVSEPPALALMLAGLASLTVAVTRRRSFQRGWGTSTQR